MTPDPFTLSEGRGQRARSRRATALVVTVAALTAAPSVAAADPVVVGVFVPSTPFDGTAARLEFANKLAAHLAGADGVGRVYGKAGDFAAALA